jgi:hypothetical protein
MSSLRKLVLLSVPAFVACGGSDKPSVDAPVVSQTIMVSGTASEVSATGSNPSPGVLVQAFANSAETTPVAMATTDASGNYTLVITTGGAPVDGFVKGTKAGLLDTYLYAPITLTADFAGASLNMVTQSTFDLLSNTLCAANQVPTNGAIAVIVHDAAGMPVAGATVTSSPAASKYCYNMGAFPNKSATVTDVDGIAYMFNVTGNATVSAAKSGLTFHTHAVNARAGAFTTTLIQP